MAPAPPSTGGADRHSAPKAANAALMRCFQSPKVGFKSTEAMSERWNKGLKMNCKHRQREQQHPLLAGELWRNREEAAARLKGFPPHCYHIGSGY
ncbi:hypothetical protein EGM87_00960 [Sphingobium sp. RSMS]|nr:hypothetical protein EGM87_00960 [Sphingobium sp. RSMS]